MSPGFTQPLRFTPEGGAGKLRPVSLAVVEVDPPGCVHVLKQSNQKSKSCNFTLFPPRFCAKTHDCLWLQVRAAPPPPKQHPRRPQQEKGDKTEEVEITLV